MGGTPLPKQDRYFVFLLVGAFLVYAVLALVRYYTWRSTAGDMGSYIQALWLLSHGLWAQPSSLTGVPPLAQADSFVLVPLAFWYRITGVFGVLVLQSALLVTTAIPLRSVMYKTTKSYSGAWLAALLYLWSPAILELNLFDFHPDVIGVAAFAWAIWAIEGERPAMYAGMVIVAALTKNVDAAIVGAFIVPLLWRRKYVWAAGTVLLSITTLLFDFGVVDRSLSHHIPDWNRYYGYLGHSPKTAVVSLVVLAVHHWGVVLLLVGAGWALGVMHRRLWPRIAQFESAAVLLSLLASLCIIGLYFVHRKLAPFTLTPKTSFMYVFEMMAGVTLITPFLGQLFPYLVPGLAIMSLNILAAQHWSHLNPLNQYSAPAIPFIVVSAVSAIDRLRSKFLVVAVGLWSLAVSLLLVIPHLPVVWPTSEPPVRSLAQARALIPSAAPVITVRYTTPEVSNRVNVQSLWSAPLPGSYAFLETWTNPFNHGAQPKFIRTYIKDRLASPRWRLVYHRNHVWVLCYRCSH